MTDSKPAIGMDENRPLLRVGMSSEHPAWLVGCEMPCDGLPARCGLINFAHEQSEHEELEAPCRAPWGARIAKFNHGNPDKALAGREELLRSTWRGICRFVHAGRRYHYPARLRIASRYGVESDAVCSRRRVLADAFTPRRGRSVHRSS